MKKTAIALAAVLMLAAAVASAQNRIGVFGDTGAGLCSAPMPVGVSTTLHVLAVLEDIEAIRGAEFKIAGYPTVVGPPNGFITPLWDGLVIGDPIHGISVAFPGPVNGPVAHIGSLAFFPLSPAWLGTNKVLDVEPAESGRLIVADGDYNEITVAGWVFVGNCIPNSNIDRPWVPNPPETPGWDMTTGNCQCESAIPVEDTNWGAIKALY